MLKIIVVVMIVVVVIGAVIAGYMTSRAGYETASYRVVQSSGNFEVRQYPPLVIAETSMTGGDNNSFGRLFRFITGGNAANQKISMTTPVFMSGVATNSKMAFVLPSKIEPSAVPQPSDGAVTIRKIEGGHFCVYRYSGGRSGTKESDAIEQLRSWMQSQNLPAQSEPIFAFFDPPWTPPFLRRNEVMIRTVEQPKVLSK